MGSLSLLVKRALSAVKAGREAGAAGALFLLKNFHWTLMASIQSLTESL